MKKKVLFIGCNFDQINYLEIFKKLNFLVIGTDIRESAPGKQYCDKFYNISYYDYKKFYTILKKEKFSNKDIIFTAASHHAYETISKCYQKLRVNFPNPKNIDICLDKVKFYKFCKSKKISVPRSKYIDFRGTKKINLQKNKIYFLKSDYGKTPNYCFKIKNGKIPIIPKEDKFFRKYFILQEEFKGAHYRINFIKDKIFTIYKPTENKNIFVKSSKLNKKIYKKLSLINKTLGLNNLITKYDVIVNGDEYVVLDIGLDTPLRLKHLLLSNKINFYDYYVKIYSKKKVLKLKKLLRIELNLKNCIKPIIKKISISKI
jgi:hypothetical protein